jgi:thiol-disulfide isomerase/thioredoxin
MRIGEALPTFEGATEWLNGSSEDAEKAVKDSPALIYFWATSCGICKENMPKLKVLKEKYPALKTIAVHMPRYEADTNLDKVRSTIEEHSIKDICAVDNKHKLKEAFKNEQAWVPVYYLFDAEGKLKSRAAGEYGVGVLTKAVEKMFQAKSASA